MLHQYKEVGLCLFLLPQLLAVDLNLDLNSGSNIPKEY
uniref:Uncharacterized protein n=1 Tax=Lepeophtheirus salmonis TaxID=72036 RepID=A0A0K2UFU3_LEPSM